MPLLGSSPLGLVLDSNDAVRAKIGSYVLDSTTGDGKSYYTSLFGRDSNGQSTNQFNYNQDDSDLFNISTQDIISFCDNHPMMKLTYADFAYLKNLGVYPNNRLIIARRFAAPVNDDLINNTESQMAPLSTLISWVPDNEEFFEVSYNENWTDAETSIKNLLNEASENRDLLAGDNAGKALGTYLMSGAMAIPLPGWAEGLQYEVFKELGLTSRQATDLPFGNPNLIRKAKRRETAGKDDAFEGMSAKISVKMIIEYEQKFISGVDPTGVYYDIIANALSFGTSDSKFMFNEEALGADNKFSIFLNQLGSGDNGLVLKALTTFANALGNALSNVASAIVDALTNTFSAAKDAAKSATEEGKGAVSAAASAAEVVAKSLFGLLSKVIAGVVSKYKVRIVGILDALTGSPSTPWHVTIGNPKRPIFSSGDMLTDDIKLTFGKLLAYNDLPSSIKIELTLTNARGLGAQEIFRKLNCGQTRTFRRLRLDIASTEVDASQIAISKETQGKLDKIGTKDEKAVGQESAGSNSGDQTPLANEDQSKSTSPSNKNNPVNKTAQATPNTVNAEFDCVKNYNFIIDQIILVLALKDTYGSKGKPLLEAYSGTFIDDAVLAANIIRSVLIKNKLKANVDAVGKCAEIKGKLDNSISAIIKGVNSRSNAVKVEYFVLGSNTASRSFTITQKILNCDY